MSFKSKKIIALSVVTSFVAMSFLFSGITFGAFLNRLDFKNNISEEPKENPVGKFGGGDGTRENPYKISTTTHLHNLQKLTMADVFTGDDYFKLTNNIDCNSEHFVPIGTEEHPFKAHFDGQAYSISNIVIDGANTNDIGLFGYTGITSEIKQLGLIHPTINLTANPDGGSLETTNLLDTPEVRNQAKNLNITVPPASGKRYDLSNLPTSFYLPLGNINYLVGSGTSATNVELPIEFEISKPDFVYQDSNNPSLFHLKKENIRDEFLFNGFFTLQVAAYVNYTDFETMTSNKFVLERWSIEIKKYVRDENNGATDIGINLRSDAKTPNIYKNIFASDENGNEIVHGVNIGFMIGHCDGAASYLGVYGGNALDSSKNAIINMDGRSCRSNSSLIGRDRFDNPYDNTAKNIFKTNFEFANFSSTTDVNPFNSNYASDLLLHWDLDEAGNKILAPNTTAANKYNEVLVKRQHARAINFTDNVMNEHSNDKYEKKSLYCRYYPKAQSGDWDGRNSMKTITDEDGESSQVLSITGPLRTGAYITPTQYEDVWILVNYDGVKGVNPIDVNGNVISYSQTVGDSNFYVENGFWAHATRELKNSGLDAFFSSPDGFKVEFNIKYKVNAIDPTVLSNSEFCIFSNQYKENRTIIGYNGEFLTSDVGNLIWTDKMNPGNNGAISPDTGHLTQQDMRLVNSVEDYGKIQTRKITFGASLVASSRNELSPMFAIGIGTRRRDTAGFLLQDTQDVDYVEMTNSPSGRSTGGYNGSLLGFKAGSYNCGTDAEGYKVFDKKFYYDRSEMWDPNIESVDVYECEIAFTTKDGNVSSLTNNIDFLSFDPTTARGETGTFSKWEANKDCKPAFNYVYSATSGLAKNVYYRKSSSIGLLAKVNLEYKGPTNYEPYNNNSYQTATIRRNNNI